MDMIFIVICPSYVWDVARLETSERALFLLATTVRQGARTNLFLSVSLPAYLLRAWQFFGQTILLSSRNSIASKIHEIGEKKRYVTTALHVIGLFV